VYDTNAANYMCACRYWDHRDIVHAGIRSTTEICVFRREGVHQGSRPAINYCWRNEFSKALLAAYS